MVDSSCQCVAIFALLALISASPLCDALRLRGQWRPTSQFFHFVARFATEGRSRELGVEPLAGNAFGNITLGFLPTLQRRSRRGEPELPLSLLKSTSSQNVNRTSTLQDNIGNFTTASSDFYNVTLTSTVSTASTSTTTVSTTTTTPNPLLSLNFRLLLLDHDFFNDVYTNRTFQNTIACKRMLYRFSQSAFDAHCNDRGSLDLFRTVPCPINGLCVEEDNPANVVPGFQFRFSFRDAQPRMWYLALVACYRDLQKCDWRPSAVSPLLGDVVIEYDIWLVNGDPIKNQDDTSALIYLARYQFSYELRDLLLLRLAGLVAYSVLLALIVIQVSHSTHALCRLLIAAVSFDTVGLLCTTLSTLWFGIDGEGTSGFQVFGDLLLSTGQSCLLLILMFLARGWTVSSRVLRKPGACIFVWLAYVLLNLFCVGWLHASAISLPVISSGTMAPEWTTPPGFSIIALRLCALGFFALQMRETILSEHSAVQLNFYHRFAASSLVWFVSWPVIVAIANCGIISPLDRPRTLVAFDIVIDAVALCVLLHIFRKSLNVAPHKVPIVNLATAPVSSSTPSSASKLPNHRSAGNFSANLEMIYFSLVGLGHSLYDWFRLYFPSTNHEQAYSPLHSANVESLAEDIAMEEMSSPVSTGVRAPATTAKVAFPPNSTTSIQVEDLVAAGDTSKSPSPDWFEVELCSASVNSNLSDANNSNVNGKQKDDF